VRSCCDNHSAGQEHPRAGRFPQRYDLCHFMSVRMTTTSLTGAPVIAVCLEQPALIEKKNTTCTHLKHLVCAFQCAGGRSGSIEAAHAGRPAWAMSYCARTDSLPAASQRHPTDKSRTVRGLPENRPMYWQLGAPQFTSWFGNYEPHPRHFRVGMRYQCRKR
jgi:hypothetical protein